MPRRGPLVAPERPCVVLGGQEARLMCNAGEKTSSILRAILRPHPGGSPAPFLDTGTTSPFGCLTSGFLVVTGLACGLSVAQVEG